MKMMKPLLVIGLLILVAAVSFYLWSRRGADQPEYQEVPVKRGSISVSVLSTGVVQPENRVDVKPPIAGRAEAVFAKEGDRIRKGQTLVMMSSTERAALLDAARARGPEELARWEEIYRPTPILAPISGTVILRSIEAGQTFATTDSILVMSDRLTVVAQVDETDLAQIKVGQSATVLLDAYPSEPIPARVSKIAYEAKTVNNVTTYAITVVPDEVPSQMRSGMTANVNFKVAEKTDVLLAPAEAVKSREGERYVLLPPAGKNQKPMEAPIEIGLTDGKSVEVVSGLTEGDRVLIAKARSAGGGRSQQGTSPFSPMGGGRRSGR